MKDLQMERDALAALVAEQCDQIIKLHALARYVRTGQDYAGAVAAMKRVFGDSLR